ncbi:hypothetical protein B8A15_05290, partial [Staphylococcus aureus]
MHIIVSCLFASFYVGARQLTLPVEFLFEILCVGAHTPTCI